MTANMAVKPATNRARTAGQPEFRAMTISAAAVINTNSMAGSSGRNITNWVAMPRLVAISEVLIPKNRGNDKFVRLRSPENVIEELTYRLGKCRKPSVIVFNDEVFGMFEDWVEEFRDQYLEHVNISFDCELVPHLIK